MKHLIYGLLLFAAAANATPPASTPTPTPPPSELSAEQTASQLRTLFFDASREGNNPMLDTFIEAHYDLNIRDEQGYTGLILAAYHGHEDSVIRLIDAGADPCAKDNRGNTALMGAIFKGELSIAKRLVQADCGANLTNNAGQTAAMYAALFKRTEEDRADGPEQERRQLLPGNRAGRHGPGQPGSRYRTFRGPSAARPCVLLR